MRLFIAVQLPPHVSQHLADAVPTHIPMRWQAPDRWHITLVFLGEVAEDRVHRLATGMDRVAARHSPTACRVRGSGTFGDAVLWAGVEGDLGGLARDLRRAGRSMGIMVERRRFTPHVTLARIRAGDPDPRRAKDVLRDYEGPAWTVPDITLVRSRLDPDPGHEILHRSPLTRPIG